MSDRTSYYVIYWLSVFALSILCKSIYIYSYVCSEIYTGHSNAGFTCTLHVLIIALVNVKSNEIKKPLFPSDARHWWQHFKFNKQLVCKTSKSRQFSIYYTVAFTLGYALDFANMQEKQKIVTLIDADPFLSSKN